MLLQSEAKDLLWWNKIVWSDIPPILFGNTWVTEKNINKKIKFCSSTEQVWVWRILTCIYFYAFVQYEQCWNINCVFVFMFFFLWTKKKTNGVSTWRPMLVISNWHTPTVFMLLECPGSDATLFKNNMNIIFGPHTFSLQATIDHH